jgi:hypothetical protein
VEKKAASQNLKKRQKGRRPSVPPN